MAASSVPAPVARPGSTAGAIVLGGLAAGLGDLAFACVYYDLPWAPIARFVAAGLVGREAAQVPGFGMVALGTLLHFVIATGAAAIFVLAAGRVAWLRRFPGPAGLGYGIVVYGVMTYAVVPLSAVAGPAYPPALDWGALGGHMAVVGLPIALACRWVAPRPERECGSVVASRGRDVG